MLALLRGHKLILYTTNYFVNIMHKCIQPFDHEMNNLVCFAFCARKYVLTSIFCGNNANSLVFFMNKRHYGVSWTWLDNFFYCQLNNII